MERSITRHFPEARPYMEMDFSNLVRTLNGEKDAKKRTFQLLALREKTQYFRRHICTRAGIGPNLIEDAECATWKALIDMVGRYDGNKATFQTFSFHWIYGAARAFREKEVTLVRHPASHHQDAATLRQLIRKHEESTGDSFSVLENESYVLKTLRFTPARLRNTLNLIEQSVMGSTSTFNDITFEEQMGAPGHEAGSEEGDDRIHFLHQALATLSQRSRSILEARHGWNGGKSLTLQEIANTMSLTRERIRQIEFQAMRKVRNTIRQMEAHKDVRAKDPDMVAILDLMKEKPPTRTKTRKKRDLQRKLMLSEMS